MQHTIPFVVLKKKPAVINVPIACRVDSETCFKLLLNPTPTKSLIPHWGNIESWFKGCTLEPNYEPFLPGYQLSDCVYLTLNSRMPGSWSRGWRSWTFFIGIVWGPKQWSLCTKPLQQTLLRVSSEEMFVLFLFYPCFFWHRLPLCVRLASDFGPRHSSQVAGAADRCRHILYLETEQRGKNQITGKVQWLWQKIRIAIRCKPSLWVSIPRERKNME